MKPIKPKKMSKALEQWLMRTFEAGSVINVTSTECRSILAALAYERQRAEEWAKAAREATQSVLNLAKPRLDALKVAKDVFALSQDGMRVLTNDGRLLPLAEYQHEQTAAVVPKPRRKKS